MKAWVDSECRTVPSFTTTCDLVCRFIGKICQVVARPWRARSGNRPPCQNVLCWNEWTPMDAIYMASMTVERFTPQSLCLESVPILSHVMSLSLLGKSSAT